MLDENSEKLNSELLIDTYRRKYRFRHPEKWESMFIALGFTKERLDRDIEIQRKAKQDTYCFNVGELVLYLPATEFEPVPMYSKTKWNPFPDVLPRVPKGKAQYQFLVIIKSDSSESKVDPADFGLRIWNGDPKHWWNVKYFMEIPKCKGVFTYNDKVYDEKIIITDK